MADVKEKRFLSDNAQLMAAWDYEKNGELNPAELTCGSKKKVWWKCPKGHSYQQIIHKKTSRNFGCPVCSGHLTVSGVNDFATFYPEAAKEWHPTKNGELLPSMFSKKNGRRFWWKCEYGHEWEATIHDRADGTGCPVCSKRRTTSFPEQIVFYYAKKKYPDAINRYRDIFDNGMELDVYIPSIRVAIEFDGANWHNTQESFLREEEKYRICRENDITLVRIKEKLEQEDHLENTADGIYYIRKKNYKRDLPWVLGQILDSIGPDAMLRAMEGRLPLPFYNSVSINVERDKNEIREYLTPIPNSLAELRPDLVAEWNYEKNGKLVPAMFGINSNDKVWWMCGTCGHEWATTIIHRGGKRNSGCPECSKIKRGQSFTERCVAERGSLADNNPALAQEWHPTKNGELLPCDITEKRFKKAWWLCKKCGYEWEASPSNRSQKGVGCPACSGRVPRSGENDLKTLYPAIAAEWCFDRNDKPPEQFLPMSGKKVWWRCASCGYEWEAIVRARTRGSGCPMCKKKRK